MIAFVRAARLFVDKVVASSISLLFLLCETLLEARQVQIRFEAQFYRIRYRRSSKNDEGLQIVR